MFVLNSKNISKPIHPYTVSCPFVVQQFSELGPPIIVAWKFTAEKKNDVSCRNEYWQIDFEYEKRLYHLIFLYHVGVDINNAILYLAMYWLIIVVHRPELNIRPAPCQKQY
jgi:hypothetical protein